MESTIIINITHQRHHRHHNHHCEHNCHHHLYQYIHHHNHQGHHQIKTCLSSSISRMFLRDMEMLTSNGPPEDQYDHHHWSYDGDDVRRSVLLLGLISKTVPKNNVYNANIGQPVSYFLQIPTRHVQDSLISHTSHLNTSSSYQRVAVEECGCCRGPRCRGPRLGQSWWWEQS